MVAGLGRTATGATWAAILLASRHHSTATSEKAATAAEGIGPLAEYDSRVAAGELTDDVHQRRILGGLERCFREVEAYPGPPSPRGLLRRLLGGQGSGPDAPLGLYLWGTVGTGKTMLMDLFFDCVRVERKRRVHFNAFMLDVHERIHQEKRNVSRVYASDQARYFEPDGTYTVRLRPHDPIRPVAKQVLDNAWLICFDEFQVRKIPRRERERGFILK